MTFSQIQRRAFLVAVAVLTSAVALILCYWQGVRQGTLPSPVQPIGGLRQSAPAELATVHARQDTHALAPPAAPKAAVRPSPAVEQPTAQPAPLLPTPKPAAVVPKPAMPADSTATEIGVLPARAPEASKAPAPTTTPPIQPPAHGPALAQPEIAPAPRAAELALAQSWLDHTNQRPVIRAHYEVAQILQLVELGRGLIVASSSDPAHPRELYLQSKPGTAPLFAPYTENVAARFSSYNLVLGPSGELGQLTGAFSLYFPKGGAELAFVPDRELARQIFLEIARARPAAHGGSELPEQMVVEGQLAVTGAEPSFKVLEIR